MKRRAKAAFALAFAAIAVALAAALGLPGAAWADGSASVTVTFDGTTYSTPSTGAPSASTGKTYDTLPSLKVSASASEGMQQGWYVLESKSGQYYGGDDLGEQGADSLGTTYERTFDLNAYYGQIEANDVYLSVYVLDADNNTTTVRTDLFNVDTQAPRLESPAFDDGVLEDGATVAADQTLFVEDLNFSSLTANGTPVEVVGSMFNLSGFSGDVTLVATDSCGNKTTVAVTVGAATDGKTVVKG